MHISIPVRLLLFNKINITRSKGWVKNVSLNVYWSLHILAKNVEIWQGVRNLD